MITLITGGPGCGKTALAVAMMLDEGAGRELFVDGITDLTVPCVPVQPLAEWTRRVPDPSSQTGEKLEFDFPAGSLIILDEAQRVYRPRASGAAVPPHVAAFETHRHQGLDFWLITQHPGLIDANVRKLVGRHIHLRATLLGRRLYEWPEVGDVESKSSRDLAAKRRYKLPTAVFSKYKSAEVHTKQSRRVPVYAMVAGLATVLFLGSSVYIYRAISAKLSPAPLPAPMPASGPGMVRASASSASGGTRSTTEYFAALVPRVPGLPHTAPAYDKITEPTLAPFPAACVAMASKCRCYTSQATLLEMDDSVCRRIVAGGLYQAYEEMSRHVTMESTAAVRSSSAAPGGAAMVVPDGEPLAAASGYSPGSGVRVAVGSVAPAEVSPVVSTRGKALPASAMKK